MRYMNLFDKLVSEALKNQPTLSSLRIAVEKELLHHDILRTLRDHNLLVNLTFIGGTCLRCCYGAIRLSEDLDFTGGSDFNKTQLSAMGNALIESLQNKYGLSVKVSEPLQDKKNVNTWKIKVETRPEQKHLPSQRINIDICSVPSYEKQPMLLLNPYGVEMGTSGLIIQAQSREEIYTDKLLAFALRPNRIKYRDLWDIVWLHQQGLKPNFELIPKKIEDRNLILDDFLNAFNNRRGLLTEEHHHSVEFKKEMNRFFSTDEVNQRFEQDGLWQFITQLMNELARQIKHIEFY